MDQNDQKPWVVNERRRFYRIDYPTIERPRLFVGKERFDVLNVSEGGVHLLCELRGSMTPGCEVVGRIDFQGREEANVAGVVCRTTDTTVTIELTVEPVPLRIIMSEQRYLIGKYDLLR